jgi:hypothetical protein
VGAQPWTDGWKRLLSSRDSATDYQPRPVATVIRGGEGANVHLLFRDAAAAYQNALRWKITGDAGHGDKARDILNAWSATLKELGGNADRYLLAGIQGYQLANAGEIMRDYDGFDLGRFQSMLVDIFYPMNDRFLVNHNDAVPSNYRANWELCTLEERRRQRLCQTGRPRPARGGGRRRPRAVGGERPGPGAHHGRCRLDGRALRDGLEPGRGSVRVRRQPTRARPSVSTASPAAAARAGTVKEAAHTTRSAGMSPRSVSR